MFSKQKECKFGKLMALVLCVAMVLSPCMQVSATEEGTTEEECSTAYRPNQVWGDVGEAGDIVTIVADNNTWWGTNSKATTVVGNHIDGVIGNDRSIVINSSIEEGFQEIGSKTLTAPLFKMDTAWKTFNMAQQDLMFYVEMPYTGTGSTFLRIDGITMDSWNKYPTLEGMGYSYLARDGKAWVAGRITNDNKQLNLPDGFRGYIRLELNTASNAVTEKWSTGTFLLQEIQFYIGAFGGDYGAFKFGGVWFVSKDDHLKVNLVDENQKSLGLFDLTEAIESGRDSIIGALTKKQETADVGETSDMVSVKNMGNGDISHIKVTAGKPIAPFGTQKSVVFSSSSEEGFYGSHKSYLQFTVNQNWANINLTNQYLMFYLELPETSEGFSAIRFTHVTFDEFDSTACSNMKYSYLSMDSTQWISSMVDGDKTIILPNGFKGFIRMDLDSASSVWDESKKESLETWERKDDNCVVQFGFQIGAFGGSYGDAKLGGVWVVSKNDSAFIRLSGPKKLAMTSAAQIAEITSASVNLGADLSVKYYAQISGSLLSGGTTAELKVTMNGKTETLSGVEQTDGRYLFTYTGIGPHQMTENIKAELYIDGKLWNTKDNFTVANYCKILLGNPNWTVKKDIETKTGRLILDLLQYGAAAQTYQNYKMDCLATKGLDMDSQKPSDKTPTPKTLTVTNGSKQLEISSATVVFDSQNHIQIRFKLKGDVTADAVTSTIKINGEAVNLSALKNLGDGVYAWTSKGIKATELSSSVTVEIYDNESSTAAASLTYSVDHYATRMCNKADISDAMKALAQALYHYGVAAAGYTA